MGDGKLRVMQIIRNLEIGGAQEVVRTLAEYLVEEDCAPVVCAFRDGPIRSQIERLGIPVEILPDRRHGVTVPHLFVADMLRIRRALADIVERHQIDVIQTHLLQVLDFLVLTLRRHAGPRVFWSIHNYNFTLRADQLQRHRWLLGPKRMGYRLLYRLAARWVDGFIAVSDEVRTALLDQIGPIDEKIMVICNGVDVRRYCRPADRAELRRQMGLSADAHLMTLVGTLKRQKGHQYLIDALREILPSFPRLHVLFVGDGELGVELRARARSAGVDGHVHFLGSRGDVPAILAASDSFVLPSLWEGLPMALIEAMASGLPIVATEVSGTKQVMIHGETGLLVAPGDVGALVSAIVAVLSDQARACAMGAAARDRVESAFSAKKQAEEHIALFRRAAECRTGKQRALHLGTRP
jgi:glycosyltransferase involved in cell wall biosynthesis